MKATSLEAANQISNNLDVLVDMWADHYSKSAKSRPNPKIIKFVKDFLRSTVDLIVQASLEPSTINGKTIMRGVVTQALATAGIAMDEDGIGQCIAATMNLALATWDFVITMGESFAVDATGVGAPLGGLVAISAAVFYACQLETWIETCGNAAVLHQMQQSKLPSGSNFATKSRVMQQRAIAVGQMAFVG